MSKIAFITTNKHKFEEISLILKEYGIEIEQVNIQYSEDKEKDMKAISSEAAKELSEKLNRAVFVEDTGLYFDAYNDFPGAQPKFVFNGIGFDGILRLLDGKSRKASFKTVIGFCEPGEKPKTFEGIMHGKISEKVLSVEKDAMPYDHVFVPDGYEKAIVDMSLEEKNSFSQRGVATRALGEYLKNK